MRDGFDKQELINHEDIMATFADPIIILFLGGFILVIAASKAGLDVLLARTLLKPFGKKSENVLLFRVQVIILFAYTKIRKIWTYTLFKYTINIMMSYSPKII